LVTTHENPTYVTGYLLEHYLVGQSYVKQYKAAQCGSVFVIICHNSEYVRLTFRKLQGFRCIEHYTKCEEESIVSVIGFVDFVLAFTFVPVMDFIDLPLTGFIDCVLHRLYRLWP
jgi:hypothetical protein